MSGPLDGLRVVDFSTVLMGPYATQILADWGAEVTKVESLEGDISRGLGIARNVGMGPTFLHLNRNKKSIAIDLKRPESAAILERLLGSSDVFVSNVRRASLERMNIGPDVLLAAHPRLIVASLTGYGEGGPYAGRPAYDDLVQGQVAIPSLFRKAGSSEPRYVPLPIVDRFVGLRATGAILAAVVARGRTGLGQKLEVPMFETMADFVLSDHLQGETFDPPNGPPGYARLLSGERRPFATRDGYVCLMIYTDRHWRDFLTAIGKWEQYRDDTRFQSINARTRHTSEVYGVLMDEIIQRDTADWLELCAGIDVPAGPFNDLEALIDDPHLRATGFFQAVEHPTEGRITAMAIPERWSHTPAEIRRQAPRLGGDTIEVLGALHYSSTEIDALLENGIVKAG